MQHSSAFQSSDEPLVAFIPRINIGIFCDNQQTAMTFQGAASDRRMSRAHVTLSLGGIQAAVQSYQEQATPNLLVVETRGNRDQILSELGQLAEVCQPTTKVLVVGHVNDVILYRELIRQGISEYMVAPLSQLQIVETIATLYCDPDAQPLGRVLAFIGAKGGVGSSTIAHNVAHFISTNLAIDTVITDLDLAFGTAGLNFNQDGTAGIMEALAQPDRIDATLVDRLLLKLGDKLSLLGGAGGVDRDFNIESHGVETILSTIRANIPYVVVDVPNMWAPWIKHTLVSADVVVITAMPDLACLRNAKYLIDMLRQARPNDPPPLLVLNQVGMTKRPEIPAHDFAAAIGLELTMVIPHDPQTFGTAQTNGHMIVDVAPRSKAAEAIQQLGHRIIGDQRNMGANSKNGGLTSLFDKLQILRKK